jgi:2-iminobutanoate/2-iminopropanoate deaminase
MNDAYKSFFPQPRPARATVRARLMNPIFDSEIQCVAVKDAGRSRVAAEGQGRPDSPFSPAIQVGDFLYLAGFVGRGAEGFAAGDVSAQTRQTLARLQATLAAAGMDFSNVVNAQVYLTDIRHYGDMNAVYAEVLPKPPPARATVGAPLMSPDALVEIMMVAVR